MFPRLTQFVHVSALVPRQYSYRSAPLLTPHVRVTLVSWFTAPLAGLAFSIHVLGYSYFEHLPVWPRLLMILGTVCFFAALYRELRRTRGNTIDDVVSQSRL